MKYFPLKTALLCLVLPPLLYMTALSGLAAYLGKEYDRKITNLLVGEPAHVLEGTRPIEALAAVNISDFLSRDFLVKNAGLAISVQVTTRDGRLIYPSLSEDGPGKSPEQIAAYNYDILNQGLEAEVEVRLDHGTWLPNLILVLLAAAALAVFVPVYREASRQAARDKAQDQDKVQGLVNDLKEKEEKGKRGIDRLKKEKMALFQRLKNLRTRYTEHRKKSKATEDELFDEIVKLEEQRDAYAALKAEKESEIEALRAKLQKIERRKGGGGRRNEFDYAGKRFSTLYKQVDMHRKAVSGYLSLSDDLQIKAEEVILQLDRNPDLVTIKRKVFSGKKHKTAVLEVLFAYNGRLYFRALPNNRVEILVIGTKKSQTKDMEFLHKL